MWVYSLGCHLVIVMSNAPMNGALFRYPENSSFGDVSLNVAVDSSYLQGRCLKYRMEWNSPALHIHTSQHQLVGMTSCNNNRSVCV